MVILSMLDYPRSVTRSRWHEIWSQRRRLKHTIRNWEKNLTEFLREHPDAPAYARREIVDKIANPPLFSWPEP